MADIDSAYLKNFDLLKSLINKYNATSVALAEKYTLLHYNEYDIDEYNGDTNFIALLNDIQDMYGYYSEAMNRYKGECAAFEYSIKELANTLNISVEKIYKESTFNYFWRGKYYSLPRKYYEYSIID